MRGKYYESSDRRITKKAISNGTRIAPTGSILLLVRGSMLYKKVPVGITSINVAFNQDVKCLIPKDDINTEYLFYFLRASEHLLLSKVMGTGIGAGKLDTAILKGLRFYYPEDPTEQQKIVDTLSSLDALITAHTDKLTALREHKQGLLQQLFPGEGELVPELRFGGFVGEWESDSLGKIAKFSKGKGVAKKDIVAVGKTPCIRYGELYTIYDEVIDGVVSKTDLPKEKLVLSKGNEIIIPSSGETKIDIARASCVIQKGVALGGDLNIIRSKLNSVFFSYYLNGAKKRAIAKIAQGNTVIHLYNSQLEKLRVAWPSPTEQQKIADCLTALDDSIAAQSKKIKALRNHKKGLMQRLFSKPNGK